MRSGTVLSTQMGLSFWLSPLCFHDCKRRILGRGYRFRRDLETEAPTPSKTSGAPILTQRTKQIIDEPESSRGTSCCWNVYWPVSCHHSGAELPMFSSWQGRSTILVKGDVSAASAGCFLLVPFAFVPVTEVSRRDGFIWGCCFVCFSMRSSPVSSVCFPHAGGYSW